MVKGSIVVIVILFLIGSYCCVVQGKAEDEVLERLYREMLEADTGKDEK